MGRIFGKFADSSSVRIGIIEFKDGIITNIEPNTNSPLRTHRYDPRSYVIFPGFVDPYVIAYEESPSKLYHKAGFTHVRQIPCGKLVSINGVSRLNCAQGEQYVIDFSDTYTSHTMADIHKLHESLTNGYQKHITFFPEYQSSLVRYKSNTTVASQHPPICEVEGLDIATIFIEKYWLKAATVTTSAASLKRVYESYKKGFAIAPLVSIRHLVSNDDKQDTYPSLIPPLRTEYERSLMLKNAFVMPTTMLTMLGTVEELCGYGNCIASLIEMGVSLRSIALAASEMPNLYLGRENVGKLAVGQRADFTVLSNDGSVETYVGGQLFKK